MKMSGLDVRLAPRSISSPISVFPKSVLTCRRNLARAVQKARPLASDASAGLRFLTAPHAQKTDNPRQLTHPENIRYLQAESRKTEKPAFGKRVPTARVNARYPIHCA